MPKPTKPNKAFFSEQSGMEPLSEQEQQQLTGGDGSLEAEHLDLDPELLAIDGIGEGYDEFEEGNEEIPELTEEAFENLSEEEQLMSIMGGEGEDGEDDEGEDQQEGNNGDNNNGDNPKDGGSLEDVNIYEEGYEEENWDEEGMYDEEGVYDEEGGIEDESKDEDAYTEDGEDSKNPPKDECTCELGALSKDATGGIKDSSNLLSDLKNYLSEQSNFLNDQTPESLQDIGLTEAGVDRMLGTIDDVEALIDRVENGKMTFRFESTGVEGNNGETTKDINTGEYVITVDEGTNDFGVNTLLIHELAHAGQIMDGQVGFDANGNATMIGMEDELSAYQLMYDYMAGAEGTPDIATSESIINKFPGVYDDLPSTGGSCPVHG